MIWLATKGLRVLATIEPARNHATRAFARWSTGPVIGPHGRITEYICAQGGVTSVPFHTGGLEPDWSGDEAFEGTISRRGEPGRGGRCLRQLPYKLAINYNDHCGPILDHERSPDQATGRYARR